MFSIGSIVKIVGHPEWDGSVYRDKRAVVVAPPGDFRIPADALDIMRNVTWVRMLEPFGRQEGPIMFLNEVLESA